LAVCPEWLTLSLLSSNKDLAALKAGVIEEGLKVRFDSRLERSAGAHVRENKSNSCVRGGFQTAPGLTGKSEQYRRSPHSPVSVIHK
jgi:hypothetical protein